MTHINIQQIEFKNKVRVFVFCTGITTGYVVLNRKAEASAETFVFQTKSLHLAGYSATNMNTSAFYSTTKNRPDRFPMGRLLH